MFPFNNPDLDIADRVADLVARLTLEEKCAQMVNDAPAIERLGIPAYNWWNEGLHGVARAGVATVFPQAIGLAATWNTDLMHLVATAISEEARAKHHEFVRRGIRQIYTGLTIWSPNVNLLRDPRWGRGQETYGEDPCLTGQMGVAFVRGLQGDDPHYLRVIATPKHFAVHSGPELGRHGFNAVVSVRDLYETYLPAFKACIQEGGAVSIMGAYNRTNGEACCASPTLLGDILREEWGFEGYVVSDCGAIGDIYLHHRSVETAERAAALSIENGCDLNCCDRDCAQAATALVVAVRSGLLAEAHVDRSLTRLLTARMRLGLFDPDDRVPYAAIPYEVNDSMAHRKLALQAARESIVLLKNENGLLPLSRNLTSIAVIGPNADDLSVLLGNYHGTPVRPVSALKGIREKVAHATRVYYAHGCAVAPGVPSLEPIPPNYLRPANAAADKHGLTAAYFDNPNFIGSPVLIRVEPVVDKSWKHKSPLGGPPTEPFSAVWTGRLIPPISGIYKLGASGSSDYRLWLDDEVIIPFELNDHEPFTRTIEIELEAGRIYEIQLDYANTGRDPQARLLWAMPGGNDIARALEVAGRAEVVVLVLGLNPALEGEEMGVHVPGFAGGDRTDIALPATQEDLLKLIVALGKPVVLVLMNGGALAVNWAQAHVPAIVEAWYPGQEGGTAIADVLFGDYNPAGRLPATFYKSVEQLPPFDDYAMAGRTYRFMQDAPLYPFGHGLSYTQFEYAALQIAPMSIPRNGTVEVSVEVKNSGEQGGDEVVQLYVRFPESRVRRPALELKGFARISLPAGESGTVTFSLGAQELAYYDEGWVVEPGRVEVLVGASSADIRAYGALTVQ